ncbi:MAG TPA: pseudouridine synthase [Ktedonobacteraceae bacterium]|jgi:pseudouridine synthase|nr:pseudouridine synthase [Ktedonobacteraceae bacterium]
MTQQEGERLARFLARAGVASRRHAEELIAAGRVQVNGATITSQGTRINPQRDTVTVDGKAVQTPTRHVYIMLHKPTGYVTTAADPQGRPTVLDLLPVELRRLRVYPVGRLDIDTSGLLLLTNDGDFAQRMTHPRYSTEKHYEALVRGCPTEEALAALREGVTVVVDDERSYRTSPAQVRILQRAGANCRLALTIHEGRKRQVRRMISTVGYKVLELKRVAVGKLTLGDLPVGEWRYLRDEEVRGLM